MYMACRRRASSDMVASVFDKTANEVSDMSTTVLDTKGLNCPLPVLRAKKAMKEVPAGGILQILATDPGTPKDLEAFCRAAGHELVDWKEEAGVFTFNIRKAA